VLPALANEHRTISLGGENLGFSANRTAAGVIFLLLETLLVVGLASILHQFRIPGIHELTLVVSIIVMGAGALLFVQPFQEFFDRKILGINLRPESLVNIY
jgi:hypothetical protein